MDEAARKVLNYLIEEKEEKDAQRNILDNEGGLTSFLFESNKKEDPIIITQVELIQLYNYPTH